MPAYIDLVFSDKADDHDFEIITPATPDAPGLARLAAARIGTQLSTDPPAYQILSSNGGAFIGYLSHDSQPLAPFQDTYYLDFLPSPSGRGVGGEGQKEEANVPAEPAFNPAEWDIII